MIKMSFYNGTLNRAELTDAVRKTEKPILFTYGLAYRNPTTYKVPVSVEKAVDIIEKECFLDAEEFTDHIHLNAFSANDMY